MRRYKQNVLPQLLSLKQFLFSKILCVLSSKWRDPDSCQSLFLGPHEIHFLAHFWDVKYEEQVGSLLHNGALHLSRLVLQLLLKKYRRVHHLNFIFIVNLLTAYLNVHDMPRTALNTACGNLLSLPYLVQPMKKMRQR